MKDIKERLIEHFYIQDSLNKFLVGENWREEIPSYKILSAILSEIGELVDSTGFKWWTKQDVDENNIKIEIVDIWHFLLTWFLKHNKDEKWIIEGIVDNMIETHEDTLIYNAYLGVNKYEVLIDDLISFIYWLKKEDKNYMFEAFNSFSTIIADMDIFLDEFDEIYRKKVEINKERKKRGYDKDSSKKYIEGKEDNELLAKQLKLFEEE